MLKAPPLAVSKDETELGVNNVYHALLTHNVSGFGICQKMFCSQYKVLWRKQSCPERLVPY